MNETEQVSAVLWYGCLGNINCKVKIAKKCKKKQPPKNRVIQHLQPTNQHRPGNRLQTVLYADSEWQIKTNNNMCSKNLDHRLHCIRKIKCETQLIPWPANWNAGRQYVRKSQCQNHWKRCLVTTWWENPDIIPLKSASYVGDWDTI